MEPARHPVSFSRWAAAPGQPDPSGLVGRRRCGLPCALIPGACQLGLVTADTGEVEGSLLRRVL